jgi:hypothetical protein
MIERGLKILFVGSVLAAVGITLGGSSVGPSPTSLSYFRPPW